MKTGNRVRCGRSLAAKLCALIACLPLLADPAPAQVEVPQDRLLNRSLPLPCLTQAKIERVMELVSRGRKAGPVAASADGATTSGGAYPYTTAPAPEATTPVPGATAPAPQATTGAPDVATPDPSATRPAPGATAPAPQATTGAPDVATPDPSATTPAPGATAPAPQATTGAPDVATPDPSATRPAPGASTATPDASSGSGTSNDTVSDRAADGAAGTSGGGADAQTPDAAADKNIAACGANKAANEGSASEASGSEPLASETASGSSAGSDPAMASGETEKSQSATGVALAPTTTDAVRSTGGEPIIIDNDEEVEMEGAVAFAELPTDEGKTHIKAGAQFPVVVTSQICSKTAKKGDPIQARLKYDLKIGDRLVARKGSVVRGHVNYALKARTILHSLVSPERWYRNSGCLGIAFDEIINERGEHLPLVAQPARQARIVKNKAEGRELGVNHHGQITGPWAQQLRYKAIRVGLNAALAPAGVFSFGAMPVALGVIGAVNPSFAFSKPVGLNVRHRRLKGFAWGFLSGVPGSWLIEDTTVKGQEAIIKPGDEFLAEINQEFTGEPAAEAELVPGASTKVRGQVIEDGKDKKSRGKKK